MKDIEVNDFGVNESVIGKRSVSYTHLDVYKRQGKRLARKNVKKVDGQFVLQSGSKMPEHQSKQVIVKNCLLYTSVVLNSLLDEVTEKYLNK